MIDDATRAKVFSYIDDRFDAFVSELSAYGEIGSISAQGLKLQEGAEATKTVLEAHGIETRLVPIRDGPSVVLGEAGRDPGKPTIALYNHYDVQPVDPLDEWVGEPFEPAVREGTLYFRGVSDTKGNVVAQAFAVEAIRAVAGDLPVNARFLVEGEEEISSPHFAAFLESNGDLLKADGATIEGGGVTTKGTPDVYLGSKGIVSVELRVRTAKTDQHSSLAAVLPNPAWRLIAALRTLRNDRGRILIPGFYENIHVPDREELRYLRKNTLDPLDYKDLYGLTHVLGGRTRYTRLKAMVYGTTCTIDGFSSGYTGEGHKTINPATAMAKLDFRLLPGQRPADIFNKLRDHLRDKGFSDIEIVDHGSFEPAATPPSARIAQAIIGAMREVYRAEPNVFPWSMGSSSTYNFTSRGTPAVAGPGVGYTGSKAHAPNEHIRLNDARKSIKATAAMLMRF